MSRKQDGKPPLGEKYPRLGLLVFSYILAFLLLFGRDFAPLQSVLSSLGYTGMFVAGLLYAYSFTAMPATAIFLLLIPGQNLLVSVLAAGFGAVIGDFFLYKLMQGYFSVELHRLSREKFVVDISKRLHCFKKYALIALGGLLISSPLPTELGVAMFSSIKEMTMQRFLVAAYLLHTFGIFVILTIGKVI